MIGDRDRRLIPEDGSAGLVRLVLAGQRLGLCGERAVVPGSAGVTLRRKKGAPDDPSPAEAWIEPGFRRIADTKSPHSGTAAPWRGRPPQAHLPRESTSRPGAAGCVQLCGPLRHLAAKPELDATFAEIHGRLWHVVVASLVLADGVAMSEVKDVRNVLSTTSSLATC